MAFDSKEYTRLRDIAQKRIKRGEAAGLGKMDYFLKVKELKQMGEFARDIEMMRLQQFINTGFSLERRRQYKRDQITDEQRRQNRREQSRDYRRRKTTRDYSPEKQKQYRAYLKALKTLKKDIPPSQLPAFFAYLDYRFEQGSSSEKYLIDIFVDDFRMMVRTGYKPDQILADFKKFEADQADIADRAGQMEGMDVEHALELWDAFKTGKNF